MAKATTQELKDMGFATEMFGTPINFDTYLTDVLDAEAERVKEAVGATRYADATDGFLFERLRRAEQYLVAAELWRRYLQFYVAAANRAGSEEEHARQQRVAREHAKHYEQAALDVLTEIGGTIAGTASSVGGYVETEYFEAVNP